MNRTTTPFVCTCLLIVLLATRSFATPLPSPNPFEAPTPTPTTQQNPTTAPHPAAQQSPSPDRPEGLGTPPPTSETTPGGLTEEDSIWKQDFLTGDWGGLRDKMLNAGVAISPTYIGEVFGNPSGGARQGVIYDGVLNVALDLDLDRLTNGAVVDTLIHANALYIHGPGLSANYVGDFSNTSNIAGYNSVRLQELWIQKQLWEKRISLRVGNMAVDSEFFASSSASLFLNGTFGAFTFLGNNVGNAPVYPLAAPGVRISFTPTSKFYVMAGVYGQDMDSDPTTNNQHGTRFALDSASGMLVMSEAGFLLNQSPNDRGLQGTYRLGSWLDTGNHTTFASQADAANGTGNLQSTGANFGIYGVMDQQIYAHGPEAISLFVRTGGAPSNTNFVDYYIEGGFNFSGFVPGRESDIAGIAVARSHVSSDFSDSQIAQGNLPFTAETVIEATYKAQLAPWWSIQPDLQYIVTPSGEQGSRNAFVMGLRTSVAF